MRAFALFLAAFFGWQLQALFGMYGPRVAARDAAERGRALGRLRTHGARGRWPNAQRTAARRSHVRAPRASSSAIVVRLRCCGRARPTRPGCKTQSACSASRGTLLWPVSGGLYGRGYGSGAGGYHLAIDIDGQRGSEVMAAAAGTVGYAGHELRGYGNR